MTTAWAVHVLVLSAVGPWRGRRWLPTASRPDVSLERSVSRGPAGGARGRRRAEDAQVVEKQKKMGVLTLEPSVLLVLQGWVGRVREKR